MIAITGGAGFIGSQLVSALNQMGEKNIYIIDNLASSSKWQNLVGLSFIDYIHKNDFLCKLNSDSTFQDLKCIVHLGACSNTQEIDMNYLMHNNYYFSKELCAYSIKNNIRFIYASSAATYGDGSLGYSDSVILKDLKPLNGYAYSKYLFDLWAEEKGYLDNIVGLKFFNVYGNGEFHKEQMRSVILKAFLDIQSAKTVKLFKSHKNGYQDGEQLRDFIYVKDTINIILHFYKNSHIHGIYNVGTGKARTFNDLIDAVFNTLGLKPNFEYINMPQDIQNKYQYHTEACLKKLQGKGQYSHPFYSLEDGISDYIQSYLIQKYQ